MLLFWAGTWALPITVLYIAPTIWEGGVAVFSLFIPALIFPYVVVRDWNKKEDLSRQEKIESFKKIIDNHLKQPERFKKEMRIK